MVVECGGEVGTFDNDGRDTVAGVEDRPHVGALNGRNSTARLTAAPRPRTPGPFERHDHRDLGAQARRAGGGRRTQDRPLSRDADLYPFERRLPRAIDCAFWSPFGLSAEADLDPSGTLSP